MVRQQMPKSRNHRSLVDPRARTQSQIIMGWMRCTRSGKLVDPLIHLLFLRGVTAAVAGANAENNPNASCLTWQNVGTPTPLPEKISAVLEDAWDVLDPLGPELVAGINSVSLLSHFPHARSTFREHLLGTFALLGVWEQPADVRRCGLFHTGYSGDLFSFYVWDAVDDAQRSELGALIGAEAEALTWLFGTIHRGAIVGLSDLMAGEIVPGAEDQPTLQGGADELLEVPHRLHGKVNVSNSLIAKVMVVTMADYLDQMSEVNGWRDHHQTEDLSSMLYPGDGRPAVALYWISGLCRAVRDYLDAVPPIFGHCTATLEKAAETLARDAYWRVVTQEASLSEEEKLDLLEYAARGNPFIGEPHVLVAQLHYRRADYASAVASASKALELFYAMGTSWDKRRSFGNCVRSARATDCLRLKCRRRSLHLRGGFRWSLSRLS
jgi:hypothetical protein